MQMPTLHIEYFYIAQAHHDNQKYSQQTGSAVLQIAP
jgi:hypothetical protein